MSTQQPVKIFIPTSSMGYFHEHLGWWAVVIDPELEVGQDISFIESNKNEPFMEAKVVEIARFIDWRVLAAYLNEDGVERFVGWYIIKYEQAVKGPKTCKKSKELIDEDKIRRILKNTDEYRQNFDLWLEKAIKDLGWSKRGKGWVKQFRDEFNQEIFEGFVLCPEAAIEYEQAMQDDLKA